MGFFDGKMRKIIVGLISVLVLVGAVSGSKYFAASDRMTDEVSVVRNSKDFLKLGYVSGEELGGENKEIEAGVWNEFGLFIKNNNSSETRAWENIIIRCKFFEVAKENISLIYQNGEGWENSRVYDLRSLDLGVTGVGVDIGPENGWRINSNSRKDISIRLKIEEVIDNLKVHFQAITTDQQNYELVSRLESSKSKKVLYPARDTFIHQENPLEDYSRKNYLELATRENGNAYILLSFDLENVPENIKSGKLNLFQYWGSGFTRLRKSNVSIQVYPIGENLSGKDISWKNTKPELSKVVAEERILGNDKWYNFDIGKYLESIDNERVITLLLKFSQDNYDNEERRLRFVSRKGENIPSITIEK